MIYCKKFKDHSNYESYVNNSILPLVFIGYCENQDHVHYNIKDINDAYWYIGINMPTMPYDPESNLATSDGLGWRRIEGDIASYNSKNNPIYDGVTTEGIDTSNDSFEFYFGIPQGCVLADYFNDNINSNYILVDTVVIGSITYEFYKANGNSFDVYIYYNN